MYRRLPCVLGVCLYVGDRLRAHRLSYAVVHIGRIFFSLFLVFILLLPLSVSVLLLYESAASCCTLMV
jgi:hypothetical protein